ncbi:hypothetical protein DSO57_1015865 [Entomophthora muscae]|uniref:Uncharacterized protein n=1 Tax=Entomophthora muscae TaxID=34485 RepID=A0ACC2UQK1_9FUNG|nr:hypothetical protein DSO57_1015865 [Entomophthora muscae]
MCNKYGYVPKGKKNGMSRRAAVRSVAYSMIALLGLLGIELYQMILGSHNSCIFLAFIQLVLEHLRRTSLGFTNVIVLDNIGLHKVADILAELQVIEPGVAIASQQLATAPLRPLFLPAYFPFLNPVEEVVRNFAINAILIWPLNNDICKDLVGFTFNFGNSLPSINGSVSMTTHSRLPYQPSTDPGMTSPQHDSLCHSVYLMSVQQPLSTI